MGRVDDARRLSARTTRSRPRVDVLSVAIQTPLNAAAVAHLRNVVGLDTDTIYGQWETMVRFLVEGSHHDPTFRPTHLMPSVRARSALTDTVVCHQCGGPAERWGRAATVRRSATAPAQVRPTTRALRRTAAPRCRTGLLSR